ncbi:ferredoxin-NADP reductase [Pedobacter africanus]|uniref:Ring-1,2-phenylacetyl-CoA epoxidase subunit PaaE n=1 Tax=Pedobacter africanus TaxID=151894 RepID=A0ACC6KSW7_9SPHI|nr:iron-sulfur cluster-binding domain-containing protein [Pedobacter africanus]MDR6782359.1 ring-1,2-phenylacetyl-CoA epoxidase subunit PaaE [Pedobacter africanus]
MKNRKFIWLTHELIWETNDTVTIVFNTNGSTFKYLPGQFVNVYLVINGETLSRSYSLSSSPDTDPYPAITVKRIKAGLVSNHLVNCAEQISEWEVEGPFGSFVPVQSSYQSNHVILLSGGSGISPLLSIAKSLLARSNDVRLTLVYSNRNWYDVIFADAIEVLALRYPERMTLYHALSGHSENNLPFAGILIKERLSRLVVKKLLKQAAAEKLSAAQFFICGPNGLMKMYQEVLESLKVPETGIFMEQFTAHNEPGEQKNLPETPHEVLVHFYEQTHLIIVPPETSLLSAALKEGISFGHSCKSGTCGSCIAILTSGKVNMVKNYALTADEVAKGMILLCQSYPLSEDVTIEFD